MTRLCRNSYTGIERPVIAAGLHDKVFSSIAGKRQNYKNYRVISKNTGKSARKQ
jgi:hypothetical protein